MASGCLERAGDADVEDRPAVIVDFDRAPVSLPGESECRSEALVLDLPGSDPDRRAVQALVPAIEVEKQAFVGDQAAVGQRAGVGQPSRLMPSEDRQLSRRGGITGVAKRLPDAGQREA